MSHANLIPVSRRRLLGAATLLLPLSRTGRAAPPQTIHVGHFPNVTHVQALVARSLSRQGKGWFEDRLGAKIEWYAYNAGPSAMEAVFANSIDLTYVGPGPALNAYARSKGEEIRIVAGAVDGGSGLVVQPGAGLRTPADFRGKTIATPQLGNTQDVSARAWLTAGGLRITMTGGDAKVVPTANPDQLSLFKSKQIDAVWTVEPWISRLLSEAGGELLVDERDATTTVLVARAAFLREQADTVRRFKQAHDALTDWIAANQTEAQAMLRDELQAETRIEMASALLASAWSRIVLTKQVSRPALEQFVVKSKEAGFLRTVPDLDRLFPASV